MPFTPTDEQVGIIDAYKQGEDLIVDALAGTGKTTVLRECGRADRRSAQYLAFNKSIAMDAASKMPPNVACQPDGTLVRIAEQDGKSCGWSHRPIEDVRVGDAVVSWNDQHGPVARKRGSAVAAILRRRYDGPLVVADAGFAESRYTPEHPCVAVIGDTFEGQHLVYVMARDGFYKIGLASWRLSTGRNGLVKRAQQERADAFWILSVHESRNEAVLAEALAQHEWQIPGWCFEEVEDRRDRADLRVRRSELGLHQLWAKIAPNRERAAACLAHFGRDIDLPLWSKGQPMRFGQQSLVVAATNLMSGMRVLAIDGSERRANGRCASPRRLWVCCEVRREWYNGHVTSLQVEPDHTYVADGIVTHNCNTIHSLAMRSVGRHWRHRLGGARMRSKDIARRIGIPDRGILTTNELGQKVLQPGYLAGLVMRSINVFCQTADTEPSRRHVPWIDGIDTGTNDSGRRVSTNNRRVADVLEPCLRKAWADISDPEGVLRFEHSHYLKLWQLGMSAGQLRLGRNGGVIKVALLPEDVILVDEAQDLNPLMLAIAGYQVNAQVVWVGDPNQQIYSWNGAVNALDTIPVFRRLPLTRSWRFGQAIADQANGILRSLGGTLRLWGTDAIDSYVGEIDDPDAILCRTNATAVEKIMLAQSLGRRPHLVGGGREVVMFARAAQDLMETGFTTYHELACFDSWGEVQAYAQEDELGGELKLMVKLVEEFGVEAILKALDEMPPEERADVVVSTAHKAKGREWNTVKLAGDFPNFEEDVPDEERRLLYVSMTRPRLGLDRTGVRGLDGDRPVLPGDSVWIESDEDEEVGG